MASLKAILRSPIVFASFWFQVRRAVPARRVAHFTAMCRCYWQWALRGATGPVTVNILGFKVTGWNAGLMLLLFKEIFLHRQYEFSTSEQRPVIIDCGANIGFATLYFKWRYPEARVIAIEANPAAFELLQKNVQQNGLKDVECRQAAVADKEGTLEFYVNEEPGTLLGSVRPDRAGQRKLVVPAIRLSALISSFPEPVAAVKIDIEGAEWLVLRDLEEKQCLARPQRYMVEYHHRIAEEKSRLSSFLSAFERAGFEYDVTAAREAKGVMQDVLLHFSR